MKLATIVENTQLTCTCSIVTNSEGHILLGLSTSNDERANKWSFPGGHLKVGEKPELGAERECREETGYEVHAIAPAYRTRLKPGVAFVLCKLVGGTPKPNPEFSKLKWYPAGEAIKLPDMYDVNRKVLIKLADSDSIRL